MRDGERRLRRPAQLEQEDIEVAVDGVEGGVGRCCRRHLHRPRRHREQRRCKVSESSDYDNYSDCLKGVLLGNTQTNLATFEEPLTQGDASRW